LKGAGNPKWAMPAPLKKKQGADMFINGLIVGFIIGAPACAIALAPLLVEDEDEFKF